jgi:phosphoglycerate dehydrogenase-like enzyme
MATSFTIWCNAHLPEAAASVLGKGVGGHRLMHSAARTGNLKAGAADPALVEADIAFGQPDAGQIILLPRLKWIHLSSAGYTRYDRDEVRQALRGRGAAMTNSSSVFDEPCAEHLLAFMMSQAREVGLSLKNQFSSRLWNQGETRPRCRILCGQNVLILGFGAIGRRLAELLQPMRMHLRATRQKPRGDEPVETFAASEMDRMLPWADHVVNILPASASTERLIGQKQFDTMKAGAAFYNIGRGTTIDQNALMGALRSDHLSAAWLDVTDPEPLPPDHPLWKAPNCFITTHIGGGYAEEFEELVAHFLANLRRFESGAPLVDRIM